MDIRYILATSAVALAIAVWPGPEGFAAPEPNPFEECEQRLETEATQYDKARCFFDIEQRRPGTRDQAVTRLDELAARYPDNPWFLIHLGHVLFSEDTTRSEEAYRKAVDLATRLGEKAVEVEARVAHARCLSARLRKHDEAERVSQRAVEIAEQEQDPTLLAIVKTRRAWQEYYRGRLDEAYHLLRAVEQELPPTAPPRLEYHYIDGLATFSLLLAKTDESLKYKQQLLEHAQKTGSVAGEADARLRLAIHHIAFDLPTSDHRDRVRGLLETGLQQAQSAVHPSVEASAHRELGKLAGGDQGRHHLERCLDLAETLGSARLINDCQGALAAHLAESDAARAKELMALAHTSEIWNAAYGSLERLIVQWATLSREAALEDSFEVLDVIETLRELQLNKSSRAGLLSLWTANYYWILGRLLLGTEEAAVSRQDLEQAFLVNERMRARVLLETLSAAGAVTPPASAEPLMKELTAILEERIEIQRQLLDPNLTTDAREQLVAGLREAESREAQTRHQIHQVSPSYATISKPTLADLGSIEESLGDDEALLTYQLGLDEDFYGRDAGGAWLLVSTRNGTRHYRLPGRAELDSALDMIALMGDFTKAGPGLARLYDELLREPLGDLPPEVDKLIIVPDGTLHRLPFALLKSEPEADPLITRFQLSLAPSATLWLRWRNLDRKTGTAPVLALADPTLTGQNPEEAPETEDSAASTRGWALARGAELAPLPYARQEGKAVVRILGGSSRLLEGDEASENFVKNQDLTQFSLLHFATHTVIDPQVPGRSAVFLASESGARAAGVDVVEEDGWLQPHEIVDLDLEGTAVVLASCETAAGQILQGEGTMSVARAFFQAGAPVVVASLWQLPDDQTSTLFKEFYRQLARGSSLAEALATAQREMIDRGAAAREWAGLVVLGDGSLVPFPGGLPTPVPYRLLAAIALLIALTMTAFIIRRRSLQR